MTYAHGRSQQGGLQLWRVHAKPKQRVGDAADLRGREPVQVVRDVVVEERQEGAWMRADSLVCIFFKI
jgi:hypothetical protein